jgi:hypothetical protein
MSGMNLGSIRRMMQCIPVSRLQVTIRVRVKSYDLYILMQNPVGLNFTLKFFQEAEGGETPTSVRRSGQVIEKVIYTPQLLEQETPEFIAQLDFLASPFTFQKAQMNVFTKTLTSYLEGENEDNPSDASQMEVEED